jgi:peptidoglycan/xylan/chitin deacetylase (PgdA/CDA1 family)
MSTAEKKIYLTFDDGPIPIVTPWVLETLDTYKAKATFFCIGKNVQAHPEIYLDILNRGHQTGNHTQNHLNGWNVKNKNYYKDVEECTKYVNSLLFRPPYGKIKPSQIRHFKQQYKLVMWDVLSKDYDQNRSPEQCLHTVLSEAGPGSIIVFHDSLKAEKRLRGSLPGVLEHFNKEGYEFARLEG